MNLATLGLLAAVGAQLNADLVTSIGGPQGTPHCFNDLTNDYFVPTDFEEVLPRVESNFADVTTIQIHSSYFCYFETDQPVFIYAQMVDVPEDDQDDPEVAPIAYYFEYEGYGPDIWLNGDEGCVFKERGDWFDAKSNLELWFRPNFYGGACKYMIVLGAKQWPAGHSVNFTIVRTLNSAIQVGAGLLSVAALAFASI